MDRVLISALLYAGSVSAEPGNTVMKPGSYGKNVPGVEVNYVKCNPLDADMGKATCNTDGGDDFCCGINASGTLNGNKPPIKAIVMTYCNYQPRDGQGRAGVWFGEFLGAKGAVANCNYPAGGFSCYKPPAPSVPVGRPCTGWGDPCGGDPTMCCGIASGGKVVDGSAVDAQPLAICNKAIGEDGLDKAVDYTVTLNGFDKKDGKDVEVAIGLTYPKEQFECMKQPPTPPPPLPPKTIPPVAPLGTPCTKDSDCKDKSGSGDGWCCGIYTHGKVLDAWGARPTDYDAPNLVACNKARGGGRLPHDLQTDWETGTEVTKDLKRTTAEYSGAAFHCLSDAKHLMASALAIVTLMNIV